VLYCCSVVVLYCVKLGLFVGSRDSRGVFDSWCVGECSVRRRGSDNRDRGIQTGHPYTGHYLYSIQAGLPILSIRAGTVRRQYPIAFVHPFPPLSLLWRFTSSPRVASHPNPIGADAVRRAKCALGLSLFNALIFLEKISNSGPKLGDTANKQKW